MLSIDPGYAAMGWALWTGKHLKAKLLQAGVFQEKSRVTNVTWHQKVNAFQERLFVLLNIPFGKTINYVVCEEMQMMGGRGGAAAANTSLLGLAGTVGMWAAWAYTYEATFQLAPVSTWKGNLPKSVVAKRVKEKLSKPELQLLTRNTSHDWDAVGIGLWFQGRF